MYTTEIVYHITSDTNFKENYNRLFVSEQNQTHSYSHCALQNSQ